MVFPWFSNISCWKIVIASRRCWRPAPPESRWSPDHARLHRRTPPRSQASAPLSGTTGPSGGPMMGAVMAIIPCQRGYIGYTQEIINHHKLPFGDVALAWCGIPIRSSLSTRTAIAGRIGKKWPQLVPQSHGPSPIGVGQLDNTSRELQKGYRIG